MFPLQGGMLSPGKGARRKGSGGAHRAGRVTLLEMPRVRRELEGGKLWGDPSTVRTDAGLWPPPAGVKLLRVKLLQLGLPRQTDPRPKHIELLLADSAEDTAQLVWGAPGIPQPGLQRDCQSQGRSRGDRLVPSAPAGLAGGVSEKRGFCACPDPCEQDTKKRG